MDRSRDAMGSAQSTHGRVLHMSLDQASELIRDTLLMALFISAPMLGIGLVVGIIISLVQAVTQIQEQTLTFVPKIVAMVSAAIILMPWMSHRLMSYATEMFVSGHVR
jgi:flagellar biosynthetic protein FliQ